SAWARECESAAVFTSKTSTATVRTRSGLAGFRTGTMTGCTRCLTGKLQRNGGSLGCFAKFEGYFRLDVRPPRRPSCAAATVPSVENATEDIPKATAIALSRRPSAEDVGDDEVFLRRPKSAGKAGASWPSESAGADHLAEVVIFLALIR